MKDTQVAESSSSRTGAARQARQARLPGYAPAVAGALVLLLSVVPLELIARRYLFAETLQFAAFALVVPALVALGTPWVPRFARLPLAGALTVDVIFAGLCLVWRLPPVLDALARHPVLQLPEAVTLLVAGFALWLQLVPTPASSSSPVRLTRPQRAIVAALPMWAIWAMGYVLGFAEYAVVTGYDPAGSLGTVADQELTAALTWALSGACLLPVVAVTLITWLRDSGVAATGVAEERLVRRDRTVVRGWDRAPRGSR